MKTLNSNKKLAQAVINFGKSFYNGETKIYFTKNYSVHMFWNGYILFDSNDNKIETFE